MSAAEKVVYCQIDAHLDTNPKIRRAGRDARDIFEFLLRRVAVGRSEGTVPLKYIEPWYLADMLMMTEDEARHGTSRAVTVTLISIDEEAGVVRIVGWSPEWGRRPKAGAERTAEWRERKGKSANIDDPVTASDATSSHVTGGDESDAGEERRGEENKKEGDASAPPIESKSNRRAKRIPDRAWKAADYLREQILADEPSALVSKQPWGDVVRTGWRLDWADEFRLMVEKDGRTYEQLAEAIGFVFHGQTCERQYRYVVQSADALRKKFDSIKKAMERAAAPTRKPASRPVQIPLAQSSIRATGGGSQ